MVVSLEDFASSLPYAVVAGIGPVFDLNQGAPNWNMGEAISIP